MDHGRFEEALRAGDVDDLLRIVDGICEARDWDELEQVRARCTAANDAAHQLWPVASRAAYLLALDGPAALAGAVLVDGAGRFAPGPLPEVAAQRHTWADLAPHVPAGPQAVVAAHERVVRGEDLSDATVEGPPVLELPLRLAPWEPAYALAEYGPDSSEFPMPPSAGGSWEDATSSDAPAPGPDDEVTQALRDAVGHWADESNGTVRAVGVRGQTIDAIATLDTGTVRVTRLEPAEAIALLAWAGASGGAHGARRGAAAGRFSAWWAAGALTDLLDAWPPDPEAVGAGIATLAWATWAVPGASSTGWNLRLAVGDPARGRAWAVRAHDPA